VNLRQTAFPALLIQRSHPTAHPLAFAFERFKLPVDFLKTLIQRLLPTSQARRCAWSSKGVGWWGSRKSAMNCRDTMAGWAEGGKSRTKTNRSIRHYDQERVEIINSKCNTQDLYGKSSALACHQTDVAV
jgi:hypothetical protein